MRFTVAPVVFQRIPGMRIAVALAAGIDNRAARPDVEARWRRAWHGAADRGAPFGNAQSHPNVRAWREAFRTAGIHPREFPSSIESLLRRAMKGGRPFSINPLVDMYNAISLEHVNPVGGFDVEAVGSRLDLRLSRQGDTFTALDAAAPLAAPPGEVSYAAGGEILTRHLLWRQSRRALIGPGTSDVVLLSEALPAIEPDMAERMAHAFARSLAEHFAVEAATGVVDKDRPTFER